jgi:hypothetical protein
LGSPLTQLLRIEREHAKVKDEIMFDKTIHVNPENSTRLAGLFVLLVFLRHSPNEEHYDEHDGLFSFSNRD